MSPYTALADGIRRLLDGLESIVLNGNGGVIAIHEQLSGLAEESRFLQADDLTDALAELSRVLPAEGSVDGETVLPVLFRLRDAIARKDASEDRATPSTDGDTGDGTPGQTGGAFLELDLQKELDEVRTVTDDDRRIIHARVGSGHELFLIVVRVADGYLPEAEEILEADLALVNLKRQNRTNRIAAIAVETEPPAVAELLESRLGGTDLVRDVRVRPIHLSEIRGGGSVADDWYDSLPPIHVTADASLVERVRAGIDAIDHAGAELPVGAIWRDLREQLDAAFAVDVGKLIEDMQDALEAMALETGKQIGIEVSGAQVVVGAEIAEDLRRALFELFANAITHGIESPADRSAEGKDPTGMISCAIAEETGGVLAVRIHDDGARLEQQRRGDPRAAGLQKTRKALQESLAGTLRARSGASGTTIDLHVSRSRGWRRTIVGVRRGVRIGLPAAIVEWAGPVDQDRVVTDASFARYLRYQRNLIPLVEPPYTTDRTLDRGTIAEESGSGFVQDEVIASGTATRNNDAAPGIHGAVSAAAVLRIAGTPVALAFDRLDPEMAVAAATADETVYPLLLHSLPLDD